jgi:MoaA/NifB/PqqE/SkfB family radical SAM enzyme
MKSVLYYNNPNLSLVLPGTCQAKCDFCFWYQKPTDPKYLERVEYVLDTLPKCFYQISITGGEPTISKYLSPVLDIIKRRRSKYTQVVLTTNAIKLDKFKDELGCVDHINISRHHWTEEENHKIFKTTKVPSKDNLANLAKIFGDQLTINCVIKKFSVSDMFIFLNCIQSLGINKVCFRQEHGSLEPVTIEKYALKTFKKVGEGGCPVCRSSYFEVILEKGVMNVGIKYSVLEPKDVIDGIYELVLHSDGKLTADWEAKEEVELEL